MVPPTYYIHSLPLPNSGGRSPYLYSEYFNLSNLEVEKYLQFFTATSQRLPNLNRYIEININNEIKDRISMLLTTVQRKIINNMMERETA